MKRTELIDITLPIGSDLITDAEKNEKKVLSGHLGTHFDVMNKTFPLAYTQCPGIVFDVRDITDRDIEISDIGIEKVQKNMFVAFCSGCIESVGYGNRTYFTDHPQLSDDLIEALLKREVSIIGVDFAGVRRGKEHTPKDQYCADRGTFIVENLCNLAALLEQNGGFTVCTYPMNYTGVSGLPCRVIARCMAS